MGVAKNAKVIEKALQQLKSRKDFACMEFLTKYMQTLVEYAMQLHNEPDPQTGKVHPYHSQKVEHDFGWCVCHNGEVFVHDVGYGSVVPGRYAEMFQMFAMEAYFMYGYASWVGYIVAIIEPLETSTGQTLVYSPRFETWVFDNIDERASREASETFKSALHRIR